MAQGDAHFSIVYDGQAIAEGAIKARDLAPALPPSNDGNDERS
jgi:hypothetical protein